MFNLSKEILVTVIFVIFFFNSLIFENTRRRRHMNAAIMSVNSSYWFIFIQNECPVGLILIKNQSAWLFHLNSGMGPRYSPIYVAHRVPVLFGRKSKFLLKSNWRIVLIESLTIYLLCSNIFTKIFELLLVVWFITRIINVWTRLRS